jgi:SAM-dependent methyltransferase
MGTVQTRNPAEAYDRYFGPAIFIPWASELLERAALLPGERVLDLACGTGIVARLAAPLVGAEGEIVGVDVSPAMVEVARASAPRGAKTDFREGDAVALDLPAERFDVTLCQQGLQFFPDRAAALRGVFRALAPGGRVALAVWQGVEKHEVYGALFGAEARFFGLPLEDVAKPFMFGDGEALRALLDEAGFSRIEISEATRDVRFTEPDRFVELTTLAASAVMPEQAQQDPQPLLEAVSASMDDVLSRYRQGDELVFPMTSNFAVAYKD